MFKFLKIFKKSITGSGVDAFIANGMQGNVGDRYQRWVYACINTIAKSIAQIDLEMAKINKKEVNKIESHELISLLYNPNPKMTKYMLWLLTFIFFLKDGEVAWILDFQGKMKPKFLYVFPTSNLQVIKENEEGEPTNYKLTVGNVTTYHSAEAVKIYKNPDPENIKKGKSVISAMYDVVDNDTKMVKWNKSILDRSAVPSGSLEVEGKLDRKQSKLLKEQFQSIYSGYENAGNVAILQNGTKFNSFGIPPKDMEYIEGRKMNRDEILGIFGVPKILLGLEGSYNRATAEVAERMFAKYTLQPYITMIIEQINISLTPLYGQGLWIDFVDLDVQDREQTLKEQTAGWNKWLTTNEIREQNGLAPIEGGDEMNVVDQNVGESKKLKTIKRDFNLKREKHFRRKIKYRDHLIETRNKELTQSIFKAITKKERNLVLKIGKKKSPLDQNEELRQEIEKMFIKELEGLFKDQKKRVLENLGLNEKDLNADPFDKNEEIKVTLSIIEPVYYEAITKGAKLASEISGTDFIDITKLPETVKWIKATSLKYSEDIVDVTLEKTMAVVQEGITEGVGTDVLAKNIEELYDQMSDTRSKVIARTESARSLTAGQSREWAESGVEKFEWLTAGDSKVSAICQENSTKTWTAKQSEKGTVEYSHPNCRCMFLPK